jgi:hypothetical protein
VGGIQCIGNLTAQIQQFPNFHGLAPDPLPKRLAFQQLHHDERLAFVLADIVNGADVGMVQR